MPLPQNKYIYIYIYILITQGLLCYERFYGNTKLYVTNMSNTYFLFQKVL
jgi:hypothetical protein